MEKSYTDYAPLFDLMRGARWLLSSRPVEVYVSDIHSDRSPQNPVSLQPCDGSLNQQWEIISHVDGNEVNEIRSVDGVTCLGVWCCGCGSACCDGSLPVDGAVVAANTCHPSDSLNQRWTASKFITERMAGKCLVADSFVIGAGASISSCHGNTSARAFQWANGSITLPWTSGRSLCLSKPVPPPKPTQPISANVFTRSAGSNVSSMTGRELLISIMLGSDSELAMMKVNLKSTEAELGWPKIDAITLSVLHPGSEIMTKLGTIKQSSDGTFDVKVPLVRGCAMIVAVL